MKYSKLLVLISVGLILVLMSCTTAVQEGTQLELVLLETTDLHTHMMNYDYYQDKAVDSFGLVNTADLIRKNRAKYQNTMLFDNGDLIQGNPMGDYVANESGVSRANIHPVYKIMNTLEYDAGNIGNHEFNYGLEFLADSLEGANFPYINANVYYDDGDDNPDNDKNYFEPYRILKRKFIAKDGTTVSIKVGVIGFVPPQIMLWDKSNLDGKVIAKDIVETAEKFVAEMKKKGADIIVAIPHSGISKNQYQGVAENATARLAQIDGIDAILFGHSHGFFPSDNYKDYPGADIEKGTIYGKPAVMPGYWGNNLGVVELSLKYKSGAWQIINGTGKIEAIYDKKTKTALVETQEDLVDIIKDDHEQVLEYIRTKVATTTSPIYSYFAGVQDDPSVQIVSNAQIWYAEQYIQGTEYDSMPILSAAAPFKFGGRYDISYFTDIPAGDIAIKNVADLYVYPNTIKIVSISGAEVREWLERSAGMFNQIDPNSKEVEELINPNFRSYNFDTIDGVSYQIDITSPSRYDDSAKLVNPDVHRIVNLQYQGQAIDESQQFLVVSNNYRANGGGRFPGLDGSSIVVDSPDENRQVIINYLMENQSINPSADKNWRIVPIQGKRVRFVTSIKAKEYIDQFPYLSILKENEDGSMDIEYDLSQ